MHGRRRDSVAFTVVVGVLVMLGALVMGAVIVLANSPGSFALAAVLAALPVGPLVGCFMWLDRYEPEPRSLLAAGLLWGAFAATGAAVLFQFGGVWWGASDEALLSFLAPLTEEFTKGAFLVLLLWWRRHELDGILDGIVYAGMVGIGFAFTENILYLAGAYDMGATTELGGAGVLTVTFVIRCVISPFAHPFFTAFIGIGIGLAISSRSSLVKLAAPLTGLMVAVVLHGIWNYSTLAGTKNFFVVYLGMMFPVFAAVIAFAIYRRTSERHLLADALHDAAGRGLLPATDIPWLVDLRGRRHARAWARHFGGKPGERAMRDYQSAAIELGYLHHRYLRGTAPVDYSVRGGDHVELLRMVRPHISFPGQVVPTR
jgi:RsiW-degrading membrane proteinase PrsW (M82 family)